MSGDGLTFRAGGVDDLDLIYGAWMRGARRTYRHHDQIPDELYYSDAGERGAIARILASAPGPGSIVTVAEAAGAPVGFVVGGGGVLHWVHVKAPFRGLGLSWRMLDAAGVVGDGGGEVSRRDAGLTGYLLACTYATPYLGAIRKHWNSMAYFNPYRRHA